MGVQMVDTKITAVRAVHVHIHLHARHGRTGLREHRTAGDTDRDIDVVVDVSGDVHFTATVVVGRNDVRRRGALINVHRVFARRYLQAVVAIRVSGGVSPVAHLSVVCAHPCEWHDATVVPGDPAFEVKYRGQHEVVHGIRGEGARLIHVAIRVAGGDQPEIGDPRDDQRGIPSGCVALARHIEAAILVGVAPRTPSPHGDVDHRIASLVGYHAFDAHQRYLVVEGVVAERRNITAITVIISLRRVGRIWCTVRETDLVHTGQHLKGIPAVRVSCRAHGITAVVGSYIGIGHGLIAEAEQGTAELDEIGLVHQHDVLRYWTIDVDVLDDFIVEIAS